MLARAGEPTERLEQFLLGIGLRYSVFFPASLFIYGIKFLLRFRFGFGPGAVGFSALVLADATMNLSIPFRAHMNSRYSAL